jgi:hypothetical protein
MIMINISFMICVGNLASHFEGVLLVPQYPEIGESVGQLVLSWGRLSSERSSFHTQAAVRVSQADMFHGKGVFPTETQSKDTAAPDSPGGMEHWQRRIGLLPQNWDIPLPLNSHWESRSLPDYGGS